MSETDERLRHLLMLSKASCMEEGSGKSDEYTLNHHLPNTSF